MSARARILVCDDELQILRALKVILRDAGFDVLQATLSRDSAGKNQARVRTLLAPLGRPIDVHLGGRGKIFVLEYSRSTSNAMSYVLPGRVLELAVKPK